MSATTQRIVWLDAARGLAVVAMVAFHSSWDLSHFGYIERSLPFTPIFRFFGNSIAISFLLIAGFSLALAHRDRVRWPAFWRRFAMIAGAAALVSAGTWGVFPNAWVFFGILHVIAAASLAALPFLQAPWGVTLVAGLAVFAAPRLFSSPLFNADWLIWLGLGAYEPMTQDWRPFFPWAGALLAGVAIGRLFLPPLPREGGRADFKDARDALPTRGRGVGALTFPGRHSLAIYLAHQPALFALFTALAFFAPADSENAEFLGACEKGCIERGTASQTCHEACVCLANEVTRNGVLKGMNDGAERDARLEKFARRCLRRSEATPKR